MRIKFVCYWHVIERASNHNVWSDVWITLFNRVWSCSLDPLKSELPDGLNVEKLYNILCGYGEYPSKYRSVHLWLISAGMAVCTQNKCFTERIPGHLFWSIFSMYDCIESCAHCTALSMRWFNLCTRTGLRSILIHDSCEINNHRHLNIVIYIGVCYIFSSIWKHRTLCYWKCKPFCHLTSWVVSRESYILKDGVKMWRIQSDSDLLWWIICVCHSWHI